MKNTEVKVGDIFVTSWGYGQTNVNAYQVVEKPSKCYVILKPIDTERVEGSEGMDCCRVKPIKDSFEEETTYDPFWEHTDKPFRKRIDKYGKISMSTYANAYKWDGTSDYYCSWYY